MRVYQYNSDVRTEVVLVDENYIPEYYSHNFITQNEGLAANTRLSLAYKLRFFLLFLKSRGIDIVERVESGEILDINEVKAFIEATKKTKDEAFKELDSNVSQFPTSNKAISNLIHSAQIQAERVNTGTTNGRLATARRYIEFLYDEIHSKGIPPEYVERNYKKVCKDLNKATLRISSVERQPEASTGDKSKVPDDIFYRMLDIIQPAHPENPFKHSKIRNALIVMTIGGTGIRKGALAKTKISNCDFTGECNTIYVLRTPDDPTDPRKHRPQQKTCEHAAYLDTEIMLELKSYINEIRNRFTPMVSTHEFVFVTEFATKTPVGSPLSLSSIDAIFKKLSKVLGFKLTPHLLRHKWNEEFTDITDGEMSDDEVEKYRKAAMGWSRASRMGALYNRPKIQQKIKEISLARQKAIYKGKNND